MTETNYKRDKYSKAILPQNKNDLLSRKTKISLDQRIKDLENRVLQLEQMIKDKHE
jgi:hypothetical protein